MKRKGWTQADEKNAEVPIKMRKQEVPAIMRMKAEALKAMIRNQEDMILTGAQEGQTMVHIPAEAPDNQNNEVQSKKADHQSLIQDEIQEEIHQMRIQVP